ncbi:MAG: sulfatase-like hydrolase/transferase, partial [Planctomycetota bacterium]
LRHLAGLGLLGDQSAQGIAGESSVVRTWHLDERHHVANWTADRAVDFLGRRDPTRPFFLNVNFFHPHPPITPPSFYADRYLRLAQDRPEVFTRRTTASWSDDPGAQRRGYRWNATRAVPDDDAMLELRAFYWAQINHVDDQIQRVLTAIDRSVGFGNTMVVFTSDHGEMLGDHGFMRKRLPYEPSARVPMLVKPPEDWGIAGGEVRDELVGLRDVMPTLLDAAGVETRSVDGRSLLPLCRGEAEDWRTQLHGECSATQAFDTPTGMQYLVADLADGHRWKLCHFPGHGRQQLFNLTNDPQERHDVSGDPDHAVVRDELVGRMVAQLADRPEDFVVGGQLAQVDGNTTDVLPGCA